MIRPLFQILSFSFSTYIFFCSVEFDYNCGKSLTSFPIHISLRQKMFWNYWIGLRYNMANHLTFRQTSASMHILEHVNHLHIPTAALILILVHSVIFCFLADQSFSEPELRTSNVQIFQSYLNRQQKLIFIGND